MTRWTTTSRIARFWQPGSVEGRVICGLCPRKCEIKRGKSGFCGVRSEKDGQLYTSSYGVSLPATEEVIETEAVYHHSPGARILSLGNIGCNMRCDFCQNWETSQVRHLDARAVQEYRPDQIVEICQENEIGVISWTYNDPVVWQEFVVETSRAARKAGITTLYKSALYIESEPLDELLRCIDIFSISLKSLSAEFYRLVARGVLEPILEGIRQIHAHEGYLEISQLIVTKSNDDLDDRRRTIGWILDNLGDRVPLHFVGFHPAYKMLDVERTSLERLLEAQELALSEGVKHCYIGNAFEAGVNDTRCEHCRNLLVERFGLTSKVVGISADGRCLECGAETCICEPHAGKTPAIPLVSGLHKKVFSWSPDLNSVHIVRSESNCTDSIPVKVTSVDSGHVQSSILGGGIDRFLVSRRGPEEQTIEIQWDSDAELRLLPLSDRAHYPTRLEGRLSKSFRGEK